MVWLQASPHSVDPDAPLFPNVKGAMPSKATVVTLFEAIGTLIQQDTWSDEGIRLFGGHSARVTGSQLFAALGIDVNKIRILARHSGETILRYVQDAPLRSLRSDLGLTPHGTLSSPFAVASRTVDSVSQRRLHSLTAAMARLEELVEVQNLEIDAIRGAAAVDLLPTYVQHTVLNTVHRLRKHGESRTICGLDVGASFKAYLPSQPQARSHHRVTVKTYAPVRSLAGVPGILICERCLKSERTAALAKELIDADLSGDEVEE